MKTEIRAIKIIFLTLIYKIIYKIWYFIHNAIDHQIIANQCFREFGTYSEYKKFNRIKNVGGYCNKCGKSIVEIYEEMVP